MKEAFTLRTLAIDTSAIPLSVAIIEDGVPVASVMTARKKNHSVTLMPAVQEALGLAQLKVDELDRLIVAAGPGSYTGVRIAVTTAKTLAWTTGEPLYAVSSLAALTTSWAQSSGQMIVPLIDARRQHFFSGFYQWQSGEIKQLAPDDYLDRQLIVERIQSLASHHEKIVLSGDLTDEQQDFFAEQLKPTNVELTFAQGLQRMPIAAEFESLIQNRQPVADLDAFAPIYLRLTEAEVNWQAQHPNEGSEHYVEQV